MAGLPHYKNAHVAMEKWEPVYMNLYEVLLRPPESVDNWDYVMDNVRTLSGLDGVEKVPPVVEQIYKGARRRFSAAFPDDTTVDLTLAFDVNLNENNSAYVYKGLRKWCDLIFDPLTGSMTLKRDYAGGPMTVSLYNRAGDIFRQYIFPVVWPMAPIAGVELDYEGGGGNLWTIEMTFAADYWEDMSL